MRLVGFLKDGKGTLQETEDLFAASGTIEVVKTLAGGLSVIQVEIGQEGKAEKRGRKPKEKGAPLTAPTHNENPAE